MSCASIATIELGFDVPVFIDGLPKKRGNGMQSTTARNSGALDSRLRQQHYTGSSTKKRGNDDAEFDGTAS
jgi:hypothetical protein